MAALTESLLDITITPLLSPEPELQRGRKRRRDFFEVGSRATIPSTESATFRGRCRYRSSSRYLDMSSRPTSQHRAMLSTTATTTFSTTSSGSNRERNSLVGSPSPSRRKMIRITQLAADHRRPRNRSPSRSRSPCTSSLNPSTLRVSAAPSQQQQQQRRRHRTQSRSRVHTAMTTGLEMMSCGDDGRVATTSMETLLLPVTGDAGGRRSHIEH
ncbi:hypothetical protein F5Y08DRAFT_98996 [Xylaria arbuscula]|nr:hypothetical protein F5Y08DRAFT_98996 [Xylaria arbuscula]